MHNLRLAAFALVLLTTLTRLPALLHPLAIDDEAIYSIVANEIVDGGKPYVDAVERKPPLLFYTYAAVFTVAGKYNWHVLHVVALLWTLATMAGLYVIARNLFDRQTGLTAALLYSVFQPWATWKNLAFNGEVLMNLPIVWAWAIAFSSHKSRRVPALFAAGILSCVAFLLKQPAAIAAVPLGTYFLLPSYRKSRGLTTVDSIVQFVIFVAGFWITLGLVALLLQQQGTLHEAFYWTITNHSIPHFFWKRAVLHSLAFIGACLPLLIGATIGYRNYQTLWAANPAERTALLGWLVVSGVGVAAGGRFYPHYYIQLIPPLAVLAAPFFSQLWSRTRVPLQRPLWPGITQAWLALTVVVFAVIHVIGLYSRRQPSETARYLRDRSAPDERIFVWGQDAHIYLEAQRRPACRYVTSFPLTGYVFGEPIPGLDTHDRIVPGAWENLQYDFAQHPPRYIVDIYEEQPNDTADYRISDFPILQNVIENEYEPAIRTAEGVIYKRTNR